MTDSVFMVIHNQDHSIVRPWGLDVDIKVFDNEPIWNLKVKLFHHTLILPTKQFLCVKGEKKEIDSSMKGKDLKRDKKPQRLLSMRVRDVQKKKKEKFLMFGKRLRDEISLPLCFTGGRIQKAVAGIPNEFKLYSVSSDYQAILSKDASIFEVAITPNVNNLEPPIITSYVDPNGEFIRFSYTFKMEGKYTLSIKSGDVFICSTPTIVDVVNHQNSADLVKRLAKDKEWNVEAAKILLDWTHKEEYDKIIFKDIGIDCIFGLLKVEPKLEITPLVVESLNHLLQKDMFKNYILSGGMSCLTEIIQLATSQQSQSINHFASRCLASIAYIAVAYHEKGSGIKEIQFTKDYFNSINLDFFEKLALWILSLDTSVDEEPRRNIMRALSYFSCSKYFLNLIADANLFGEIVEATENPEVEIATKRFAISTIANFSELNDITFRRRFFTDARVMKLLSLAMLPYTEDKIVSESVRALANLSSSESYSDLLLSQHISEIGAILKSVAGTDLITNWETQIHNLFIPDAQERNPLKSNFVKFSRTDDIFNIQTMKLLFNLLSNRNHVGELIKFTVKSNVIRTLILLIRSCNLTLQYLACKVISALSVYQQCQDEIIKVGGLIALCNTLNTCDVKATPHIVAALAHMPLNIKNTLVSIITETAVNKLLDLLKQSENKQLQRDAALLLSSLAGQDESQRILKEAGENFLRNLIEAVRNGAVDIFVNVNPSEVSKLKIIGKGICGTVWDTVWRGQKVALKEFDEEGLAFNYAEFKSEVALMTILRHENVVSCMGSSMSPGNLFIISELFEKGSLETLLHETNTLITTQLAVHLALGTARGMKYLHMLGIIHRDLKPGNLLVANDFTPKVTDFGLSRMTASTMTRGVGTPIYTAPEALKGSTYTQKADVYSFAFILWEIVARSTPFPEVSPFEVARKVCDEGLRPTIPNNCIFEELIERCWAQSPDKRPDFTEIVDALKELQRMVGTYTNHSDDNTTTEEELQYNYKRASEIIHRTLRLNSTPTYPQFLPQTSPSPPLSSSTSLLQSPLSTNHESLSASQTRSRNSHAALPLVEPMMMKRSPSDTSKSNIPPNNGGMPMPLQPPSPSYFANSNNNNNLSSGNLFITPPPTHPAPTAPPTTLNASLSAVRPSSPRAAPNVSRTKLSQQRALCGSDSRVNNRKGSGAHSSIRKAKSVSGNFDSDDDDGNGKNTNAPTFTQNITPIGQSPSPPSKSSLIQMCGNCGKALGKDIINFYLGEQAEAWHPHCFKCAACGIQLQDYYVSQGKIYCEKDFEEFYSPKCGACNKPVGTSYITAIGRDWHTSCLVCHKCGNQLGDEFIIEDNYPYCDSCCN